MMVVMLMIVLVGLRQCHYHYDIFLSPMTTIITMVSHYDIFLSFVAQIITMVFHYNTFLAHVDDNNYGGSSGGQLRVSQQPSKLLCPASPQVHPNSSLENHLIQIILDQNKKIVSAPSTSTPHCSLEESPHPKSSKKFLCNNTTSSSAQH